MKTVKWNLGTGYAGATHEGEIEFDDDATEEEIEEAVQDAAWQRLDLWWEVTHE